MFANIIKEARNTFSSRLEDTYRKKLIRKENAPFGSEQFIMLYLQEVLLRLIRAYNSEHIKMILPKSLPQNSDYELYDKIVNYMEVNISSQLTISQICKDNLIGRTILQ